ncbi:methyltransferase domain-containing protein [Limisalsivibrio acetivorans]|uniref:methyltransferase domain-containing protein n=1 Tax=Limisalsivibrio acetivorans TaxID=1304888 RepID=UPI0003B7AD97|nr:methyltransferase domain-containing protein [Limisalsivibrio acetivorans]
MKVHVRRRFEKAAGSYDSSADIQRIVAADLLDGIECRGGFALEAGCGSGIFTEMYLEKCRPEKLCAFDISHAMTAQTASCGCGCVTADAEYPPFRQSSFDRLLSSSVFQWLQYPERSIPAMMKLLKPGGDFHLSIFADGTFPEMAILNGMTGFGSVYPLRAGDAYSEILKWEGIEHTLEEREYIMRFADAKAFLKKQKGTGAVYTGRKKSAGKEAYRQFCELYESIFGDGKSIPVTYRTAYIRGSMPL